MFVACLLTSFPRYWHICLSFESSNFKFLTWASIFETEKKKNSNLAPAC